MAEVLGSADTALPSFGLTFKGSTSGAVIPIEVGVTFAIYLPEYATLAEDRAYLAPAAGNQHGEREAEQPQEGTAGPVQDPPASTSTAKKASKKRLVSVLTAWRRAEIHVPNLRLEVPIDERHVVVSDPIMSSVRSAIDEHFHKPEAARPFSGRTRTVREDDLKDDGTLRQALRAAERKGFAPQYPGVQLTAFAQPMGGAYLISVSLTNVSILTERPFQDLSVYDCRLVVASCPPTEFRAQRFALAPQDYRYRGDASLVWAHGIACVAERLPTGELATTTLPRFYQPVVEPRTDQVGGPRWLDLAADPDPVLDRIESAMRDYLEMWDDFLQNADPEIVPASRMEREAFADEIQRFRLGRRAMRLDKRLAQSFKMANEVFAEVNASRGYETWRLFQLVYLVSELPALAAREHQGEAAFLRELEFADVLWVPTGGGKTEAYLGLLVVALLYDRLRGKNRGLTGWLKFPLRMLSVQQLSRVLSVVVVAERYRARTPEMEGEPFELGYLVGGSNTPNRLRYQAAWWPGFEAAKARPPRFFDDRRLVSACPFCGREAVGLDVDGKAIRIKHVCRACGQTLPIHMTDEEIYRYMPSVLVGTVDKLTGFAFFGEFTQFQRGPRWRCPEHGGFAFREGGKCLVGDFCSLAPKQYSEEPLWYDPSPALIIQDEMHLLREELGTFDSHYEGMLAELQRGMRNALPSKILAASATIEEYEEQIRQIYGRRPRSFPSAGFLESESFYSARRDEPRRLYVGVLPHYRRKADVAAILQSRLLTEVARLQDAEATVEGDSSPGAKLLFNYETSLGYVNSKIHGDQIADELERLSQLLQDRGADSIALRVLTGQVRIADLAEPISRIEQDTLAVARARRIRALVGTSVVSHGVDLERLNVLVMAGLPNTVADYIQATSRSGRSHVGLVVTVFDAFSRRERSAFSNFVSFHRFLDRMVEPVPVNKYAFFGADRTLPGIVLALLWDLCRESTLSGPPEGIRRTRSLQPWWNGQAPKLKPILRERLGRCYRSAVQKVNDRTLEEELIERVLHRWENHELAVMQRFDHDQARQLFAQRVLSSFRDVDEPVSFSALRDAADAFEALTGTVDEQGPQAEET